MTDDVRLVMLLRSAMPPIVTPEPPPEVWRRVVQRSRGREQWSWLDVGLAAGIAVVLIVRPDLLMLLAYHF